MSDELNVSNELAVASGTHAIDISQTSMPLDMTVRSVALTLATRHCGDTVVSEGNLYQQLKMDNKLAGPLTPGHVIHCALIFERFLWGEWSKGIAERALANTSEGVADVIEKEFQAKMAEGDDDAPVEHTSGSTP